MNIWKVACVLCMEKWEVGMAKLWWQLHKNFCVQNMSTWIIAGIDLEMKSDRTFVVSVDMGGGEGERGTCAYSRFTENIPNGGSKQRHWDLGYLKTSLVNDWTVTWIDELFISRIFPTIVVSENSGSSALMCLRVRRRSWRCR